MRTILILKIFALSLLLIAANFSLAQNIETKDGPRIFSKCELQQRIIGMEKGLDIKWGASLEVGRADILFASIASICEDEKGNFYVLDRIEHKVFKFSRHGQLLLKFGGEGEGPGDFIRPSRITITPQGQVAVSDDMYHISFFQTDGIFIKRLQFSNRLGLGFIGQDRFYAWIWRPEDKQQVMLDRKNNIIKTFNRLEKGLFSVSAPDPSGRPVMFNYAPDEYSPSLLYDHNENFTAIAISNTYEILILDNKGNISKKILRNIKPEKIEKKEKKYYTKDIQKIAKKRGWPKSVVRRLIKNIPKEKTYFDKILLSPQYVFVVRIKPDITKEDTSYPVDIFSLQGSFMGTSQFMEKPIFISGDKMYFVNSEKEGNLYVIRKSYAL